MAHFDNAPTTRLSDFRNRDGEYDYYVASTTEQHVREELLREFMDTYGHDHHLNYSDTGGASSYVKMRAERENQPPIFLYFSFPMNTFENDPDVRGLKELFWRLPRPCDK